MPEEKKSASAPAKIYGIYQKATGSLTLSDHRFTPLEVKIVPVETKDLADPDETPVKFYDTNEAAAKAVVALAAQFERDKQTAKNKQG